MADQRFATHTSRQRHGKEQWEVVVSHPTRGPYEVVGNPVRAAGSTVPPSAAPRFGQHTHQLLADDLGLEGSVIDDLVSRGIAVTSTAV